MAAARRERHAAPRLRRRCGPERSSCCWPRTAGGPTTRPPTAYSDLSLQGIRRRDQRRLPGVDGPGGRGHRHGRERDAGPGARPHGPVRGAAPPASSVWCRRRRPTVAGSVWDGSRVVAVMSDGTTYAYDPATELLEALPDARGARPDRRRLPRPWPPWATGSTPSSSTPSGTGTAHQARGPRPDGVWTAVGSVWATVSGTRLPR